MNSSLGQPGDMDDLEPDLHQVAALLASSAPSPHSPDSFFRSQLRRRLVKAAREVPARRSWSERILGPRPLRRLTVPAALALLLGTALVARHALEPGRPEVLSDLSGSQVVNLGRAITLQFPQAMDHASVSRELSLRPATAYSTRWDGNVLTIVPVHGLAPGTSYQVSVGTGALTASGTPLRQPVQLQFTTEAIPAPAGLPLASSGALGIDTETPLDTESTGDQPRWSPDGSHLLWLKPAGSGLPELWSSSASGADAQRLAAGVLTFAVRGSRVAWVSPSPRSAGPRAPSAAAPTPSLLPLPVELPLNITPNPLAANPGAAPAASGYQLRMAGIDGSTATVVGTVDLPWVGWIGDRELLGIRFDGAYSLQPEAGHRLVPLAVAAFRSFSLQPTGRYLAALGAGDRVSWYDLTNPRLAPSPRPAPGGRGQASGAPPRAGESAVPAHLAWSPDGAWAALTVGGTQLWKLAPGGDPAELLVGGSDLISDVAWSADSSLLLFQRRPQCCPGQRRLWVVDAHGQGLHAVAGAKSTDHPFDHPAWGPQGDRVAYGLPGSGSEPDHLAVANIGYGRLTRAAHDLAEAEQTLHRFMEARLEGHPDPDSFLTDSSRANFRASRFGLSGPPGQQIRHYNVVTSELIWDHESDGGEPVAATQVEGVTAEVRFRVRLTADYDGAPQSTLEETLLLVKTNGAYLIDGAGQGLASPVDGRLLVTGLRLNPAPTPSGNLWSLELRWNGELDPSTLAPALGVTDPGGAAIGLSHLRYDPELRAIELDFAAPPGRGYTVRVGTSLRDLDHRPLANGYSWSFDLNPR